MQGGEAQVETLQLIYDRLIRESARLRDARRAVTAQLGPLPAAAAVVLGLFSGLPEQIDNRPYVWAALACFVVAVGVSMWGIGRDPYRHLAAALDAPETTDGLRKDDFNPREQWLLTRITREREIYYGPLQASFERERTALLFVQFLVATEVVLLVLARLLA